MQRKMEERQQAERLFAGLSPEVQQNIDAQIQSGKVIEAIKIVRVNSGAGLKDAKQAVDARRASMGAV
jgi:ribosomal protein L7/L12